jgi:hypothetical protein
MSINNNQITNIYRRLLYKKNIAPINVLTSSANSLYDDALYNLNDQYITFLSQDIDASILNASIVFVNDPTSFVSQPDQFNKFTNKVLFFHDDKILKMKKEDLFLFNNEITKYECYTFDKKISAINSNIIPIEYGFEPKTKINNSKSKSIILLGNQQNIDIIMHNQIKQIYGDVDLINTKELLGKDLSGILSQYRICITMNSKYNSLLAASNGCFVISNIDTEEANIPYGVHASDFDTIIHSIDDLLSKNISLHEEISENIVKQYNYSIFATTISKIVQNTCNRIIRL